MDQLSQKYSPKCTVSHIIPQQHPPSLREGRFPPCVPNIEHKSDDYVVVAKHVGEFEFYRDQLWTSPELLRTTSRPTNGTQKADVYSFAIILQEIIFRAAPYFIDVDTPKGM